jgi:hypothetical protein
LGTPAFDKGRSCCGEGRLGHANSETVAQPTRRWRNVRANQRWGARSKSRSGQTGPQAVCGRLRDMPSQRTRSCQGPLQTYALPVPAKALRDQFEFGLGAHLLSGVRRYSTARPVASRRGEAVVSGDAHFAVLDPSARVGAGAVGRRGRDQPKHRRFNSEKYPSTSAAMLSTFPIIFRTYLA